MTTAGVQLVLLVSLFLCSCWQGDACANEIVEEVLSPNGDFKAVIFLRRCELDEPPSTQASIVAAPEDLPNVPGNVLVIITPPREGSEEVADPEVAVRWEAADQLVITRARSAHIFTTPTEFLGITVTHEKARKPRGEGSEQTDPAPDGD